MATASLLDSPPTSEDVDHHGTYTQVDPLSNKPIEERSVPLDCDAWWPKQLREVPSEEHAILEVSGVPQAADLLDGLSQAHLRAFLYHALPDHYAAYRSIIFTAVIDALAVTGDVETLSSLRQTASMISRAQAHVRSGGDPLQQGAMVHYPTRSRLGWTTSLAGGRQLEATDRVRKRDVALAMLTNAISLVASNAAAEHDRSHEAGETYPSNVSTTQSSKSVRREGLPKGAGMPPMFLAPSTPTTALSMTPSQSPAAESASTNPFSSQFLQVDLEDAHGTPTSLDTNASSFFMRESSSTASASQNTSRALEKLSALKVTPRATDTGDVTARLQESSRSSSVSSRISKRHEAAERGRDSAAQVDAACEDRAKMVIATIFVEVVPPRDGSLPTASLTSTLAGSQPSRLSVRSDQTVTGRHFSEDMTPAPSFIGSHSRKVYWESDVFRGEKLFTSGHQRVDMDEGAASERVAQEGGTFVITSDSTEDASLIIDTIAVAYYTAASMLLETACLRDLGYRRTVAPKHSDPPRAASPDQPPPTSIPSGAEPEATFPKPHERHKRTGSRWSKSLWGAVQNSSALLTAALSSKPTSPEQSFDERDERLDPLASGGLKLARSRTFDKTNAPESAPGRSRTNARNSIPASLTSRLPAKLGRLFREQETFRSSIDGLPEVDDVSSIVPFEFTSEVPGPQAPHHNEDGSASKPSSAIRSNSLLASDAAPAVPLSVSPELSRCRQESAPRGPPLSGETFVRHFAEAQNIVVLVGTQDPAAQTIPTSASRSAFVRAATPQPVSYFASLSSATSAVRKHSSVSQGGAVEPLSSPPAITGEDVDTPHFKSPARWKHLKREAVGFYAKEAPGKDIPLGQVLEEMCLRAEKALKEQQQDGSGQVYSEHGACIHYIHGSHRVSVSARVYEQCGTPDAGAAKEATPTPSAFAKIAASDAPDTAQNAPEPATSPGTGILAKSCDRDLDAIYLWSTNMQTGEQTSLSQMSHAMWLFSFARFLETIIYHTQVGCESGLYDTVRLFQKGITVTKVCVAPLKVYRLEIEGPVVCKTSNDTFSRDATGTDVLGILRAEIQGFFASLEEAIAAAEASCIATTSIDQHLDLQATGTGIKAEGNTDPDPLKTLWTLRECVREDESDLLASAQATPCESSIQSYLSPDEGLTPFSAVETVNDLRREFVFLSRRARKRLEVWRQKHSNQAVPLAVDGEEFREPLWMASDRYIFPGSGYVVCEEDPLSVIAFSLR